MDLLAVQGTLECVLQDFSVEGIARAPHKLGHGRDGHRDKAVNELGLDEERTEAGLEATEQS